MTWQREFNLAVGDVLIDSSDPDIFYRVRRVSDEGVSYDIYRESGEIDTIRRGWSSIYSYFRYGEWYKAFPTFVGWKEEP